MTVPAVQPTASALPRLDEDREVAIHPNETYAGSLAPDPITAAQGGMLMTGSVGLGLLLGGLSLFGGSDPGLTESGNDKIVRRFRGPLDPFRLTLGGGVASTRQGAATGQGELRASLAYLPLRPELSGEFDGADWLTIGGWRHGLRPYVEADATLRLSEAGVTGHRVEGRVWTLVGHAGSGHNVRRAQTSSGQEVLAVSDPRVAFDVRFVTLGFVSERGMDGLGSTVHGATLSGVDVDASGHVIEGRVPLILSGNLSLGRLILGDVRFGREVLERTPSEPALQPAATGLGVGTELGDVRLMLTGRASLATAGNLEVGDLAVSRTRLGGQLTADGETLGRRWQLYAGVERHAVTAEVQDGENRREVGFGSAAVYTAGATLEF